MIIYFLITIFISLGLVALKSFLVRGISDSFVGSNILLVIAHPGLGLECIILVNSLDDESMFFLPVIYSCLKEKNNFSILCLSKGVEAGLTRYHELLLAAKVRSIVSVPLAHV
jgi:hypothetical protein